MNVIRPPMPPSARIAHTFRYESRNGMLEGNLTRIDPVTGKQVPIIPGESPDVQLARAPAPFVHPEQERYDEALLSNKNGKSLHRYLKPGCCSDVEVAISVQNLIVHPRLHTRSRITGSITKRKIPKVDDAVEWKIWVPATERRPGRDIFRRCKGLTKENCIKAIKMLFHDEEWLFEGEVLLPPVFKDLTPVVLTREEQLQPVLTEPTTVEPLPEEAAETPSTIVEAPLKVEPETGREHWTDKANRLLVAAVRSNVSPEEIIERLVSGGHRRAGLIWKNVDRQIQRLTPKPLTKRRHREYRLYWSAKSKKPVQLSLLTYVAPKVELPVVPAVQVLATRDGLEVVMNQKLLDRALGWYLTPEKKLEICQAYLDSLT